MGHWCFVSDTNLFASLCQALRKPKLALCAAKKYFGFLWIQLTIEPDTFNFSTTKLQFLLCLGTTTWTTLKIKVLQVGLTCTWIIDTISNVGTGYWKLACAKVACSSNTYSVLFCFTSYKCSSLEQDKPDYWKIAQDHSRSFI